MTAAALPRPLGWTLAGAGSILLHVAVLLLVALALTPDPVPEQASPAASLRMTTAEVRTDRAEAAQAEGEAAPEAEAKGGSVAQGTVPVDRAQSVAPPTAPAAPAPPPVDQVAATTTPSETVAARTDPAETAAAVRPTAEPAAPVASKTNAPTVAAQPVTSQPVDTAAPQGAAVTAAAAPTERAAAPALPTAPLDSTPGLEVAAPLDGAAPPTETAAPVRDSGTPVQGAPPADMARPVEAAAPATTPGREHRPDAPAAPAQRPASAPAPARPTATASATVRLGDPGSLAHAAKATLGWSGGADVSLDPASVAAIQTYMGPSPADTSGGSVRDSLGAAFDTIPCSRLQADLVPETGGIEIRGHIPDPALRDAVLSRINAAVGGALPVRTNLLVLPQPQCGVLQALDGMAMPQSRDQLDDPLAVGREAQAGLMRFHDGDILRLTIEAPEFDAWLHLDYFGADGQVVHLMPSRFAEARRVPAEEVFTFGHSAAGDTGPVMEFVPPFGREIVVVFGASAPVVETKRPLVEEAGPYLDWLRQRLLALKTQDPDFQAEWAYLLVETLPR